MTEGHSGHFKVDGVTVIEFHVRRMFDAAWIDARIGEISRSPSTDGPDTVLDFSRVEFISSAILNKLVVLDQAIGDRGGKLVVFGVSRSIRKLFAMTRLDDVLCIVEDQTAALREFQLKA